MEKENLKSRCKEDRPLCKIGDIVAIESQSDNEKIIQGKIKTAEFVYDWFYGIEVSNASNTEKTMVYSYETDTGDAKTKILYRIN